MNLYSFSHFKWLTRAAASPPPPEGQSVYRPYTEGEARIGCLIGLAVGHVAEARNKE